MEPEPRDMVDEAEQAEYDRRATALYEEYLNDDYNPGGFDCSGAVDGFGQVHSDADPGL